ncbi:MAG: 16S rRNA (guanine(527)-N(7))-methyltransferase RsmG [bacterium]|nr:16S rRNA (guanine(527)-N(7))-methyltransferase RsmG [bacterium]
MDKASFISQMSNGVTAMGIQVSDEALVRLFVFYTELERWNRKVNLVSRRPHDWISIHFLDSLAPLALGLLGKGGRVVDLGAGAGFPGVPLKIARESISLCMAEASGKKCTWLKHLIRALDVSEAQVLEGRFEELINSGWAGYFDTAVSRAAAKPWKMLDLARPFLAPGGRLLVYTTEALADEGLGRIHPYQVPGSKVPSVIWEITIQPKAQSPKPKAQSPKT